MSTDMGQYLGMFIDESKESLQSMNDILLKLETDKQNIHYINDIFRFAHTIKGMSATMGFNKVASLTHKMEDVLDLVRNYKMDVTDEVVDIVFRCFDSLSSLVASIEADGIEADEDVTELVASLQSLVTNGTTNKVSSTLPKEPSVGGSSEESKRNTTIVIDKNIQGHIDSATNNGLSIYNAIVKLSPECLLKAARAYIVFHTAESVGKVITTSPSMEDIEAEKFADTFELLISSGHGEGEELKAIIENISEVEDVQVFDWTDEEAFICDTDENEDETSEIGLEVVSALGSSAADYVKKESEVASSQKKQEVKQQKSVRVDIDRLDNLMNLVSELIIIKTRLDDKEANAATNHESIEYLERITTALHDAVMKVRMVPVERTFNRFPRTVRDLSKELGKKITLVMSGEQTEVDRTVIDEIGDPLLHLVRNSIDHGIESPEDRAKAGKPEMGTVNLRAYPDGNTVVIEVEDDGAGVSTDKVLKKALSKGIISEKEAEVMQPQDIVNLLFAPGFSTAEVITDLSGRGVGLDVVKGRIEALNGTVDIKTTEGKGSKFIIRLPLTLAIIQALMTSVNSEKYAIPINNIKEITNIAKDSVSLVQNQEVTLYRNKTLPIMRLASIVDENATLGDNEVLTVVIAKKGDVELGLVVDSVLGQQEIVIKSLGKYLSKQTPRLIAGATILGNGSVAMIIDTNQLM